MLEPLEPRTLPSAAVLGIETSVFRFEDADQDQVVVRLRGPGVAQVTLLDDRFDGADIASIELVGADPRTSLVVRAARGGRTSIGSITGGSLGTLRLDGADLVGAGLHLEGSVRRLKLDAVTAGAGVRVDAAGRRPVRLDIVDVLGAIDDPVRISIPDSVQSLRVRGRAHALALDVAGGVRRARFDGEVQDLRLRVADRVERLRVRSGDAPVRRVTLGAAGGIGSVRIDGSLFDSLLLAGARLDGQFGLDGATFAAASIDKVRIAGDVVDSVIAAGGDPGADRGFEVGEVLPGGVIHRLAIDGVLAGIDSPHPQPGIYASQLGRIRLSGAAVAPTGFASAPGLVGRAVIDPLPPPETRLTVDDVKAIIERAARRLVQLPDARNATIAVTDREGNLLGVVRTDDPGGLDLPDAATTVDIDAGGLGGLEAVDGVVATSLIAATKAGTASLLSTALGNAFTTRTAGFIIQRHFPPGVDFQDGGPLFGVQLSSLPTSDVNRLPLGVSADPGGLPLYRDGELLGGVGIEIDGTYTVDPTPVSGRATLEESVALAGQVGFTPPARIRADRVFVDGIRLDYANARPPAPASLGPALDYDAMVVAGEIVELLAPRISPDSKFASARLVPVDDPSTEILGEVPDASSSDNPLALQDFFDETAGPDGAFDFGTGAPGLRFDPAVPGGVVDPATFLTADDVHAILGQGHVMNRRLRAQIRKDRPQQSRVTVAVVDVDGNLLGAFRSLDAPVFGYDVSVQKARTAAFFSRPDAAAEVGALDGEVLVDALQELLPADPGLPRADEQVVDPSVDDPYGRHVDAAAAIGVDLDGSVAVADRTGGFLSRPNLPDGIDGAAPGPFAARAPDRFSPFNTGLQTVLIIPELVEFLLEFAAMDEADALAAYADGTLGGDFAAPLDANASDSPFDLNPGGGLPARSLANGMQIFAGSVPLYKDGALVGGVGVSGDGIEQDDLVAFAAASGFQEFGAVQRADAVKIAGGIRLPYVKFPRRPFGGF
ncbi:MAG: hypothetical protein CMJ18_02000 [Phycisphaeraceae bacterium]|nr:hypothetical protein [Phycisphaeraceae bacterium]